ncbi:Polysaccharide deacetylase [Gracilibacillus orientalis]|uniref:Polysaccharide deacetylase n=1 Tax=Gracilibacillus orientalis TaxID=334253 RepID=A0A1I4M5D3_9BACI|nr:polysaccharide deacetylase family protein [Gracilibacillus orientalis]SFL98462.1 Polysaccharide deacetylase [Gracilibacillus orientalis]
MKKGIITFAIIVICFVSMVFGSYQLMNSRSFQLFGDLTAKVETKEKVVAITFDDGPTKNVNEILSLLEKYNAKATFFLIGEYIEEFPKEAEAIVQAGHQVANHTYSHNRMIFKSPSFIKNEIEKTNQLIREIGYKGQIDFRPPNGKKIIALPWYLHKNNIETIMWNLEPDSSYEEADDKVNYVVESIEPGSIILMHPMYDDTGKELKSVEGILEALSQREYQFITVNELQDI